MPLNQRMDFKKVAAFASPFCLSLSAVLSFPLHNPLNKYPTLLCMACLSILVSHPPCSSIQELALMTCGPLGAPFLGPGCLHGLLWSRDPMSTAYCHLRTCSVLSWPAAHCHHSGTAQRFHLNHNIKYVLLLHHT